MRDGRIGFSGTDEIDPLLDLQARRVISGVETFIRVRGTMKAPELSFSSNPPLDQADILSLIVFNQPINELGEGQQVSLAEQRRRAGGRLSHLGPGPVDWQRAGARRVRDPGAGRARERAEPDGWRAGRRAACSSALRQAFGAEQATELILEYQIADFLRLQGSVAEGDGTRSAYSSGASSAAASI